jgi:hypothetical protein
MEQHSILDGKEVAAVDQQTHGDGGSMLGVILSEEASELEVVHTRKFRNGKELRLVGDVAGGDGSQPQQVMELSRSCSYLQHEQAWCLRYWWWHFRPL